MSKLDKVFNAIWKTATTAMVGFTVACFAAVGWETKNFIQNFSTWSEKRKQREAIAKEIMSEYNEEDQRDRDLERIIGIAPKDETIANISAIESSVKSDSKLE
ncbi:predicted protein [Naegleria gruberi]|uniref:Predicted protein n=1 Tax=Naegleria gruberi TaxID=5762 RepID=D2VXA9_NAEGR|nr:uncharacterized protein NAEGRDRAFT_73680 [Naegleria gruberi]EFC38643.1 predicted protein [Naegleria gruberi]|eukprot:XP_002671387.1 predicted protein [Naegleria gruberi strain NEG-M]